MKDSSIEYFNANYPPRSAAVIEGRRSRALFIAMLVMAAPGIVTSIYMWGWFAPVAWLLGGAPIWLILWAIKRHVDG